MLWGNLLFCTGKQELLSWTQDRNCDICLPHEALKMLALVGFGNRMAIAIVVVPVGGQTLILASYH